MSPVGLFTRPPPRLKRSRLQTLTLKNFSGGWNTIDDDELLSLRYAITLENFYLGTDGSQILRWGTQLFTNVKDVVSGTILDGWYFRDRIVVVMTSGEIATVDAIGTPVAIWNAAIAAALPGAPGTWSGGLTSVDFVPFKEELVIHNGVDKPITISKTYVTTYLQDLATGSNVNVPIGKYGCVVSNYHVVGGIPMTPTDLVVSSVGTSGTFIGDPAPNDSIEFDVGAYAPSDTEEIRGIAGFRNFLLIFFRQNTLVVTLGNYVSTVHTPQFNDTLPHFGLIGHRCIVPIENDLLFGDPVGVASAKRNLFAGLIESKRLSQVIATGYMREIRNLSDTVQKEQCFAVQNQLDGQMMLFSPSSASVYVYTFNDELRVRGWSRFTGWNYTCAIQSAQGRIFLGRGTKLFRYGNSIFPNEDAHADELGDYDQVWSNAAVAYVVDDLVLDGDTDTVYKCLVNHNSAEATFAAYRALHPTHWTEYLGESISFDWEWPWTEFNDAESTKKIKYVKIGSKGKAIFTISAFVDGLCKDEDGNIVESPAISMDFVGHEQTVGTGRRSNNPRLYGYPVHFKRVKARITGTTREKLRLNSFTFLYKKGNYRTLRDI